MKSHDYHMLMQQLLFLCLQELMVVDTHMVITRLNHVFKHVCVKVWNLANIVSLLEDVAIILCMLMKEFPTTFFEIMIHLVLHVVDELDICGPIHN